MSQDSLKTSRKGLASKITRIHTFASTFSTEKNTIEDLKVRLTELIETYKQYETIQGQLEIINYEQHEPHRESIENNYLTTKALIITHINNLEKSQITPPNTQINTSSDNNLLPSTNKISLPNIIIPTFNGKYEEWRQFYEMFVSIIDKNTQLSEIEKLYYLKNYLRGEALSIVEGIPVSSGAYETTLKLLCDRYNNEYLIINTYLRSLFELPSTSAKDPKTLRNLTSACRQTLRSLNALNVQTDNWDPIIIYMITQKLDHNTKLSWEIYRPTLQHSTLENLYTFLDNRANSFENISPSTSAYNNTKSFTNQKTSLSITSKKLCTVCNKEIHPLYQCETFKSLTVPDKWEAVKMAKVCTNCLRTGHHSRNCESRGCNKCKRRHNTLLHEDKPIQHSLQQENTENASTCKHSCPKQSSQSQIYLSTVQLDVLNKTNFITSRALLDSASHSNFITSEFVKKNKLQSYPKYVPVKGINNQTTAINQAVRLTIRSKTSNYKQMLEFLIIDTISETLPPQKIHFDLFCIPPEYTLADPKFNEPSSIDILLGAEIFFKILGYSKLNLGKNLPQLQASAFGWIVCGKFTENSNTQQSSAYRNSSIQSNFLLSSTDTSLNNILSSFWDMEHSYYSKPAMSSQERQCEELFSQTTVRNSDGRYIVRLPFHEEPTSLGNSHFQALKRFKYLEDRFKRQPHVKEEYHKFMSEYLELGHMKLAKNSKQDAPNYFLPHHPIFKGQDITKIRVVFDGSMKTNTGKSLNDILMVGPTIQQDLFSIITRFRKHTIAFTVDIQKMYRQILVHEDDQNLQKILWRPSTEASVQEYNLQTVTYGTACAPYLATKVLQRLTEDERQNFPIGSTRVASDTYVDDIMTGAHSVKEAIVLQNEIIQMLNAGGFSLHKWCSNSQDVLNNVLQTSTNEHHEVKTLGLIWNSNQDSFKFTVNIKDNIKFTKREILSQIARIYDPLGLLGPIIVSAKIIMQNLWKEKTPWDDILTNSELTNSWIYWQNQLPLLQNIEVPRRITKGNQPVRYEIHGFSDASEAAYGAVVYLRSIISSGSASCELIASKSRVAPIRNQSLPRLELNGAVVLARLVNKIITALELHLDNVFLWTDSTIVLSWIRETPNKWKTYVANRVSEIQELTTNYTWNHISSTENPADILSRGAHVSQLKNMHLWWHAPEFLFSPNISWPNQKYNNPINLPEQRNLVQNVSLPITAMDFSILDRYSSYMKMIRVTAYCLRFIQSLRTKQRIPGSLNTSELHKANLCLIKLVQAHTFPDDLHNLKNQRVLSNNSKLLSLNPFIDGNDVLRVGGRLQNSSLPFDQKHPIILPQKHKYTSLLILYEHKRLLHAGQQSVIASIRRRYWPVNIKTEVRKIIHNCVTCFRFKTNPSHQIMAPLPTERVTQYRPFINTGVDYGGPIMLKSGKRRNAPLQKGYICLFICLATRAIHLELVTSLSTESFMAALTRFTARRGVCKQIFSDNGTNFKGANNELQELYHLFQDQTLQNKIIESCAIKGINWKFIPPNAPHFGGIWEAGIKSAKYHLKRTMGKANLTFEECYTLLTEIEACLNSRPLTPISTDPTSFEILTPSHFLIGDILTNIPTPDYTEIAINRLSRWQLIQQMSQHFWKQWSRQYLSQLQQRHKWQRQQPNLSEGTIVLIKDDNIPPLFWPIARIKKLILGADGNARVATVTTPSGNEVQRPIIKLCPLPFDNPSKVSN